MEVRKVLNEFSEEYNNIILRQDNKELVILFAGNLDLYMGIYTGQNIGLRNMSIDFYITKEDYEIYCIFDNLYKEIIEGHPFGFDDDSGIDYKNYGEYKALVDGDNNITWISDEGPDNSADKLVMSKINEDEYKLTFVRNEIEEEFYFKCVDGIAVRFRNHGSRYKPFNASFMEMYHRMQDIDENYHQIHMEEFVYIKKRNRGE